MATQIEAPNAGRNRANAATWARWRRRAVAGVMAAAISLPLWNALVDPFGVFGTPWKFQSRSTNERFLKVAHLLRHPARHDAFVVGSSLMGAVEPAEVDRRLGLGDGQSYNLSLFAARPGEILAVLQALDAAGVAVRHVVYGLEPIAFSDPRHYGPAHRHHPRVAGDSWWRFWAENLLAASVPAGLDRLKDNLGDDPFIRFDVEGGGRYFLVRHDREIEADPRGFAERNLSDKPRPLAATPWVEGRFEDFGKLMEWLRQKHVGSQVYLNPLHPRLAGAYGEKRLQEFKQRIRAAGRLESLPDCTRLLDRDADQAYYDFKHFRPAVADRVLDCGLLR